MRKVNKQKGFTMVEVLLVVAIMTVLSGMGFVAVQNYTRSMAKLEYDGYAREIFIAAQNHLSMAKNLDYLGVGKEGYGVPEKDGESNETGVYYFVVNVAGFVSARQSDTLLSQMLPVASVDETLRLGGKYIIRYRPSDAVVLDVFYWSDSGRFAHYYANDYADFVAKRENKVALRTYETDQSVPSVIGWYGGNMGTLDETFMIALEAPELFVRNAERLTVTVTDPNTDETHSLRLIVKGATSEAVWTQDLEINKTNVVVLDDITTSGGQFRNKITSQNDNSFIPGEDLVIQVLAEPSGVLGAPMYSATATTNSLFGDRTNTGAGKAEIVNIRHLENLGKAVSGVNTDTGKIAFDSAFQTMDLDWNDFRNKIGTENVRVFFDGGSTKAGCFMPVTPDYVLGYDGQNHKIRNVSVDSAGSTGLFSELRGTSLKEAGVSNLELLDFDIKGGTNAGALAGTIRYTAVENVLAYNTKSFDKLNTATVTGSGSVGGLIGEIGNSGVTSSGAALVVSGGSSTGGLIGTAAETMVGGCYSGGHTKNGSYKIPKASEEDEDTYLYNVRNSGGYCGGLIGTLTDGAITNSYSTCSASGGTVGGLVGKASSAASTITDCYSVGIVRGATAGLLIGSSTASCTDCAYLDVAGYEATNIEEYAENAPRAIGSGYAIVKAMDADKESYSKWAPRSASAVPYDPTLKGNYPYRTDGTTVHHGDWPDVERLVVNEVLNQ